MSQPHAVLAGLSAGRRRTWCSTPLTGRSLALFNGTCSRGIYGNKTAVETIFVGEHRGHNRRFLQMRSHYVVDPTPCTAAAGCVENQVELVRKRFSRRALRFEERWTSCRGLRFDVAAAWELGARQASTSTDTFYFFFAFFAALRVGLRALAATFGSFDFAGFFTGGVRARFFFVIGAI